MLRAASATKHEESAEPEKSPWAFSSGHPKTQQPKHPSLNRRSYELLKRAPKIRFPRQWPDFTASSFEN